MCISLLYVCSWGWNGDGQLGHGDQNDRITPVLVESIGQHDPIRKVTPGCMASEEQYYRNAQNKAFIAGHLVCVE
jgi:hypothetical protein